MVRTQVTQWIQDTATVQRFLKVLGVVKPGVLSFLRSRTCGRAAHVPVSPTFSGFRYGSHPVSLAVQTYKKQGLQ